MTYDKKDFCNLVTKGTILDLYEILHLKEPDS